MSLSLKTTPSPFRMAKQHIKVPSDQTNRMSGYLLEKTGLLKALPFKEAQYAHSLSIGTMSKFVWVAFVNSLYLIFLTPRYSAMSCWKNMIPVNQKSTKALGSLSHLVHWNFRFLVSIYSFLNIESNVSKQPYVLLRSIIFIIYSYITN